MIKVNWEYTDTLGGEANYAWCKRGACPAHDDASDRQIVCAAKLAAGLNGWRCKRETLGEVIKLTPYGSCTVLFISFES